MKFLKILFLLILLALIGGFVYLGFVEIPIEQQEVSKEIPHEKVFDE